MNKIILGMIMAGMMISAGCIYSVDPGEAAVEFNRGKGDMSTSESGFGTFIPGLTSVTKYDVQAQSYESSETAASDDPLSMDTTVTVRYQLDVKNMEWIHANYGKNIENKVIKPITSQAVKNVTGRFKAQELITDRFTPANMVETQIRSELVKYHIIVLGVELTNYKAPQQWMDAITDKKVAEQQAEREHYRLQQVRLQEMQKVIRAEADYNVTVLNAQAEAEAINITNEQLAKSEAYLNYRKILEWDGKLPMYYGGDAHPLIALP